MTRLDIGWATDPNLRYLHTPVLFYLVAGMTWLALASTVMERLTLSSLGYLWRGRPTVAAVLFWSHGAARAGKRGICARA